MIGYRVEADEELGYAHETTGGPRTEAVQAAVTGHVLTFTGTALVAVYAFDADGGELRLAETVRSPGGPYALPASYPLSGRSPVADAFRSGHPLWLGPRELAAYGPAAPGRPELPSGLSLGALPLGGDGQGLGCLVVVDEAPDGIGADRRAFLELYAHHVAAGLEASHGPGRPEQRSSAGSTLDRLRVGAFVLELSTGRMTADTQMLELFGIQPDDFDGRVETLLASTVPDDVPALMSIVEPGRLTSGTSQLTFRIRRPNGELRWLELRCRVQAGADGAPERMLGVVAEASYLRPSADEVSMVQRLSAALAGATTIRDVGQVVVSALRDPLRARRVAVAELQADQLVVSILAPAEPTAWPEVWRSQWRSEFPDAPIHALPTLAETMREGHVSLWPPGAELEPGLAGIGPGGIAVLPLPANGRTVGVCLIGWEEPHEFGPEERSLLTATAGLVGQALVRAHALDAEHELATMLQRSLLPRKLPVLPGGVAVTRYLPATMGLEVGGDWYDVIPLSDGHVALVIGDVQGHSAAAATIMGQMRTAIRAYAVEGHPPDVVVSHANRLLVDMETDLFATCSYVDLDMEEGEAWFVRAGHLPPLLRRPDGATEELTIEGGPPLGVVADAEYPMTALGLSSGTLLVLLTDGLVESAQLDLDHGIQQVRERLARADPSDPGRAADELLGSAARRHDDVALLLLRYDGMRVRPVRARWTVWRLPDAVMHARRFAARTLRSWDLEAELDVVLLVTSELVTNAIVHTSSEVHLNLTLTADRLRIAVSDRSPRTPTKPTSVDWEATGGRGLLLVEAVSHAWGSVPLSGGKQVWSDITLSSPRADSGAGGRGR
ncbi:SpoIIE family protein phosphatase [Streptomyces sp. NA02950]|uniref:SpoIIE family protein phosphatase n=1 Tax=Streptomyces sp. NA02950 TaxID=2742137 RepID=UPI001591CA34|nr:SpoIIE family protein phosphatase [Streptomyces sp. NA02950]QKV91842.1 SpoIIE family protein phosphatase [Streptomyces sp. NA02950]